MAKMNIDIDKETDKKLELLQVHKKFDEGKKTSKASLVIELVKKGIEALEKERGEEKDN